MTGTQILNYVKSKYPKAANTSIFTESNMLIDLDIIHKEEHIKIGKLRNRYKVDKTLTTVADQLEYTLPNNCVIENIILLTISINDEDCIFEYADAEYDVNYGDYYRYGSDDNKIEILRDGKAIDTTDYVITIKFDPKPTKITLATQTPDLEEDYHNLLCYRLINRLASTGEDPDIDVANYWQAEYDIAFADIKKYFERKKTKVTTTVKTIKNVYGGW